MKHSEPGFYFETAQEQQMDSVLLAKFNELYQNVAVLNGGTQSVTVPVDSGYDIPNDTYNQSRVHGYIQSNHSIVHSIMSSLSYIYNLVNPANFGDFNNLVSIKVVFQDQSYGEFVLEQSGTQFRWVPIEDTFYDAHGNQIHFDRAGYRNQNGSVWGETIGRFTGHLVRLGISVGGSGGVECSFSCDDGEGQSVPTCHLDCH